MQGLVRSTGRHIWYSMPARKARSPNVSVWPRRASESCHGLSTGSAHQSGGSLQFGFAQLSARPEAEQDDLHLYKEHVEEYEQKHDESKGRHALTSSIISFILR